MLKPSAVIPCFTSEVVQWKTHLRKVCVGPRAAAHPVGHSRVGITCVGRARPIVQTSVSRYKTVSEFVCLPAWVSDSGYRHEQDNAPALKITFAFYWEGSYNAPPHKFIMQADFRS